MYQEILLQNIIVNNITLKSNFINEINNVIFYVFNLYYTFWRTF